MARKNWTVDEVLRSLNRKNDVRIFGGRIEVLQKSDKMHHDLGNGSHGKIDFLTNHAGYTKVYVKKFSNQN